METTTFVILVKDEPGVLNRIASVVRRRGFNIRSVSVGQSDRPGVSRMTLVIDAADSAALRLEIHLARLEQVQRVQNLTLVASVCRDLAMIRVAAQAESRSQIVQLAEVFRARIIDVAVDSLVVEITGTEDKVDGLIDMLRPYGVLEVARTGRVTMARGASPTGATASAGGRRAAGEAAGGQALACSV